MGLAFDAEQHPLMTLGLFGGVLGTFAGTVVTMLSTTGSYREQFQNAVTADLLSSLLAFLLAWLLVAVMFFAAALTTNPDPVVLLGIMPFVAVVVAIVAGPAALISIAYTAVFGSLMTIVGQTWALLTR